MVTAEGGFLCVRHFPEFVLAESENQNSELTPVAAYCLARSPESGTSYGLRGHALVVEAGEAVRRRSCSG